MERGRVFVAGLERSGTSLTYALLASHPNIAMTRRTNLWRHFFGQHGDLAEPENLESCLATMRRYKRLVVLGVDLERLRREMLSMEGAPIFREQGSNSSYGRRDPGVISTGSIGRFREVLSPREIAFIQILAGSEMASFGYQRESVRLPPWQRLGLALFDLPVESAHLMAWRARERVRDRIGRPLPGYRLVEAERAA